jgi:hypothetical protein
MPEDFHQLALRFTDLVQHDYEVYDGRLHITHHDTLLARYAYHYDRKARRLRAVEVPHIYHTPYASPQLELWELDDEQWQKVTRRPYERRPSVSAAGATQLALPIVGLVVPLLIAAVR